MKKIPDLRLKGAGVAGVFHPFTEEGAAKLAEQFGFLSGYQLREKLNDAADNYYLWSNSERLPNSSTRKDFLDEMERRAKALLEALVKDGGCMRRELGVGVDLEGLKLMLRRLAINAKVARNELPRDRPGRGKDIAYHGLLRNLRDIYTQGTGRTNKITWDDYKGCYAGHFFNFVVECLPVVGVAKEKSAVGQDISRMDKID